MQASPFAPPEGGAGETLRIKLLGEPELVRGGVRLKFGAPRAGWSLLALLLLNPRGIDRAAISAALWPQHEDSRGRAVLRRHLHALGATLPADFAWIDGDARSLRWNQDAPFSADVLDFGEAIAAGRLAEAVELYSGDLLGVLFDEGILAHRERLRAAYLGALASLAASTEARGDDAEAVRYAELLVAADEWREDAIRALMRARYRMGDRSGALRAYDRFASMLQRELRTQPLAETVSLKDAIVAGHPLASGAAARSATRESAFPIVGRGAELQSLKHAWGRTLRGSGSCAFIAGEAGIGKSTLTEQLCSAIEIQGGSVLFGRTSHPQAAPYEALVDALRGNLALIARARLDDVWLCVLSDVLPELACVRGDLAHATPLEGGSAQIRLHEAFARLIAAIACDRPLAIALEDLHWADASTIDLLTALVRRLSAQPVFFIFTMRADEVPAHHPLEVMRRRLQRERRARTVPLDRLAADEVVGLVRQVLAEDGAATEAAREIVRLAEGHPLFTVQLLRYRLDTGELPTRGGSLATVGDAIVQRVDRLPRDARAIAELAATIGDAFSVEELARIGGWSEARVFDALGALLDAKLLCERGGEGFSYGFAHASIEQAVLDAAAATDRTARHRRIAAVLEETRAENALACVRIASHWEAGGEPARAASAHARAARALFERHARENAIAHARRALALGLGAEAAFEALALVVHASHGLARSADPSELLRLEDLAAHLGPEKQFRALLLAMQDRSRYDFGDAAAAQRTIGFAESSGRPHWRAEAAFEEAKRLSMGGRLREAEPTIVSALALARESGDQGLTFAVLRTYMHVMAWRGRRELLLPELALLEDELERGDHRALAPLMVGYSCLCVTDDFSDPAHYAKAREYARRRAEEEGDVYVHLISQSDLAYGEQVAWRSGAAREQLAEVVARSRELGLSVLEAVTTTRLARLERELGHLDRALRLADSARALAKRMKLEPKLAEIADMIAGIHLMTGNAVEALREARGAYGTIEEIGQPRFTADVYGTLGAALAATGQTDEGLAKIEAGLAIRRTFENERRSLAADLCVALECSLRCGSASEARSRYGELLPLFLAKPNEQRFPGWIAVTLVKAARALGKPADAHRVLELGRAGIKYVLARLPDPEDRRAFLSLPHNEELARLA